MDEQLALRLRLFKESGQARPAVVAFVEDELNGLSAAGRTVTEETAGMLTSHLVMALTRLLDGEPIEPPLDEGQLAQELADRPEAVEEARSIGRRAQEALGSGLPESEVSFLALHLAVLRTRS
ncbi:PRD domain-containing protein [Streptomyces sp. NPDC059740]|uniref:PRD domain-containing protein n=1 Tax=Streptomyces sp. NPDC059740 TaxID=3346926 RepID=UPI003649F3CE